MELRSLKKSLRKFRSLPLHPQWLVFRHYKKELRDLAALLRGQCVLDIGCSEQEIRSYLSEDTDYLGLDYYETASKWYHTRPQIYGDAQNLPFAKGSVDAVILMDVLEHLPDPDACLREINRVLRPGGYGVLQVPFLYPIHDAPLDFQRWTCHGLKKAVLKHGFSISELTQTGKPIETAALLSNIALSKTLLNWMERKSPLFIPGLLFVPLIPLINILAWLIGSLSREDDIMPYRYRVILEKHT